ncbi:MAG: DUF327 family protein [Spirochaetaceae bacterium]|jgi:uncharacterized protein YaaR (DUF327 family)|nr:DUF327 family protein [Spirochaetaceae bacterium]
MNIVNFDVYSGERLSNAAFPALTAETKKTNDSKKNARLKKPFSTFLKKQTMEPVLTEDGFSAKDELSVLLDNVHEAGDALSKRPFPNEIKRYRLTIQKFLRYVLDTAFDIKEDLGIPNSLKSGFDTARYRKDPELRKARNKYSAVQVIDQKLDHLAAGIMAGQIKQIRLLESIEEINGLLVNLLE